MAMKKQKDIYSKVFSEFVFSDEQIELLHNTLFDMLMDIKRVCDKHNITFLLSGGSMLGAVRHKGFIPWDDDLDIMMLRSEYVKFRQAVLSEMSDKYDLVEPLDGKYTNKKPKLFLKNSVFTEVVYAGLPAEYRRVFIDVFIIEDIPASASKRKFIGKIYDFAFHASSFIGDYKYPSPIILEKGKTDEEVRKYYASRRRMGGLLNVFFGMRFYLKICSKLDHAKKETGIVGVPSAISYNREVFEKKLFTDLIEVEFNGEMFKIPSDYDSYLKNLYKDYMRLPPEKDRVIHSCAEFKLNTEE